MTIRPRRSVLYMPGSNARAIEKAKTLPVDGVILDLEDAVAPDAKDMARAQVVGSLKAGGFGRREVIVRINGIGTQWFADDLAALIVHLRDLDVDLGHQWTRRIEYRETAILRFRAHGLRHAVRAEHDGGTMWDAIERLDENGAFALQVVDDKAVVHDFMTHVNRRTELRERLRDYLER